MHFQKCSACFFSIENFQQQTIKSAHNMILLGNTVREEAYLIAEDEI
jgi:hypothetical protein